MADSTANGGDRTAKKSQVVRSKSSPHVSRRRNKTESGGGRRMFGRLRRFVSGHNGVTSTQKHTFPRRATSELSPTSEGARHHEQNGAASRKLPTNSRAEENEVHGKELSARVLRTGSDHMIGRRGMTASRAMARHRSSLRVVLGRERGCWRRSLRETQALLADTEGKMRRLGREKTDLEEKLKDAESQAGGLQRTVRDMEKVASANYLERTFLQDDLAQSRKERDAWCQHAQRLEQASKQADQARQAAIVEKTKAQRLQEDIIKEKIQAQDELRLLRADFNKLMMKAVSKSLDIDFRQFGTHSPVTSYATSDTFSADTESYTPSPERQRETILEPLKAEVNELLIELETCRINNRKAVVECQRLERLLLREREVNQTYEDDTAMLRQQVVSFAARHERIVAELRQVREKLRDTQAKKLPVLAEKKSVLNTAPYMETPTCTDENIDQRNIMDIINSAG